MFHLLLCAIFFLASGEGILIPFDPAELTNVINRERQTWNIPVLNYDEDIAKIAAQTCVKCDFYTLDDPSVRGEKLAILKGLEIGDKRFQTVGENRAASAGSNADPSPALWLAAGDWDCVNNECLNPDKDCKDYTQAVWLRTTYIGCAKCACSENSPAPDESANWTQLICNWNEAGNYNGEHPFGDDKDKICAKTYQPTPPPQPTDCAARVCTNTDLCPSPLEGATCNSGTGQWEFTGNVDASQFNKDPRYLPCGIKITGDLTVSNQHKLNLTRCAFLQVSGSVKLTGSPVVDMDFESASTDVRAYIPFASAPTTTGGPWGTPVAQNVWAPTVVLCMKAVTGSNTSYLYSHDCSIADPNIVLPDGGTIVSSSQSSESVRPPQPNSDGDINDPDLQVNPRGSIDGTTPEPEGPPSNETSGNRLPGWAIFLIVLGCIIVVAVIILLIFLLFANSGQAERF
jgi:hypothetical protein